MVKWAGERTWSTADSTVSGQLLGKGILGVLALAAMALETNRAVWNQRVSALSDATEEPAASKRCQGPISPVLGFTGWG
jgi:hypothetical protein